MYTSSDRRAKPRFSCNFPAIVDGIDLGGNKFEENATLANLSASGLFMRTNRYIEPGSKINITIFLCDSQISEKTRKLVTNGTVVRTEPCADETCGVAVKFFRYRFS